MYVVSAQAHYDSAHWLEHHEGQCRKLHGHRYVVEAAVGVDDLDHTGIAIDFADLKKVLRALANELDHECLNELPMFEGIETTAENQARYFFDALRDRLPEPAASGLQYVRIWETPTQWAMYGPGSVFAPSHSGPSMQEGA